MDRPFLLPSLFCASLSRPGRLPRQQITIKLAQFLGRPFPGEAARLPEAGGQAGGDTLFSIENLLGSSNNDTLEGNGAANTLEGGTGADELIGRNGNDTLEGGAGADTLSGALDYLGGIVTLQGGTTDWSLLVLLLFALLTAALIAFAAGDAWERFFPGTTT